MVRNRFASVLGALALTVSMAAFTSPTASATAPSSIDALAPVGFSGNAFGSQVKSAGDIANSGRTAYVVVGCTRKVGITHTNSSLAVDIPGVGHVGAVETEALTRNTEGVLSAITRSSADDASLIEGLIGVGKITTEARASLDGDTYLAATEFSIASLTIAGEPIELTGEEQVEEVPGVGTLTIGKSTIRENDNSSYASITALTLELEGGSVVRIGHSEAAIGKAVNATFGGGAYGSTVQAADGTVTSGKTANQPMPCRGTHGIDRINEIASADLPGLGTAEQVRSTVNASQNPLPEAHAMNEIEQVDIGGVLVLQGIAASVNVFEDADGNVTYNTNGTTLGSITLAGVPIEVPPPGESVELPGVGTLFFYEVTDLNGRGARVVGVRLVLTDGSEVVLSSATAKIRR